MTDAEFLRRMSRIEDAFCAKIAERGIACADPEGKRILRSNWLLAHNRADVFMEMAMDLEAGGTPA